MMNSAFMLYDRVRTYLEKTGLSQGDVAQVLGLPVRKFNYYLTEKSQVNLWPLLPRLLHNDPQLSRDWLYFGEGEMLVELNSNQCGQDTHASPPSSVHSQLPIALATMPANVSDSPIRLTGLTECGLHGWFSRAYRSVNVSPPRCSGHWIAVQAMGDSMVPHGIMEGYTLFCDPSQPPAEGEAVYALRRDGHATVKLFQGRDALGQIVLQGWTAAELSAGGGDMRQGLSGEGDYGQGAMLPAGNRHNAQGRAGLTGQEPYTICCPPADIVLLAPVIYIKCRL